jgi:putative SOS response-associated peptidase YedK
MCGRYGRSADKQRIAEAFHAGKSVFDDSYFAPSYNVAPQSMQPIIRLDSETGERGLTVMRWGLVPFWAKDGEAAYNRINARAETITDRPAFREAFKRRRCLIPADFFYEWQTVSANIKQPFAFALKHDSLFAFAGLWERWKDRASGSILETYTIITTDANELMEPIHNRMPVILHRRDWGRWLEPGDPQRPPVDLLRPFDAEQMKAWRVKADVGNVQNNRPDLVQPI